MQLTRLEQQILNEGARRVGITEAEASNIVYEVAAGLYSAPTPDLPGFGPPVRPRYSPHLADKNLVLAYDPDIPESYSTGWGSGQQASAARFDGRDLYASFPDLWVQSGPLLSALPTRLALNLLVADIAHTGGTGELVGSLARWGALTDADTFEAVGKQLSLAAKGRAQWLDNRLWYVEINVLVGCRYPDSESDARVSDEIRTTAGVEMVPGAAAWEAYVREGKTQLFQPALAPMSLQEYIASLEWKTDGAASMSGLAGISFTVGDAEGILRLSKALVPYATTLEELVSAVANLAGTTAVIVKAIIKLGETSKDRVIYPYALAPTVAKAYLLHHIKGNGNYPLDKKQFTSRMWNTSLGESGWSEIFRHLRTLSLASPAKAKEAVEDAANIFAMALVDTGRTPDVQTVTQGRGVVVAIASDVKAFDKQVGASYTHEFWDAVRSVVPLFSWNIVSPTVSGSPYTEYILPPDVAAEYNAIPGRKTAEKLAQFEYLVRAAQRWLVENRAYLTSGTLETTKVGNRVSYLACRIAAKIIIKLYPASVDMFDVRGDDQLATLRGETHTHAMNLAKLWWLLTSAYFEYSPEKSRISAGNGRTTEFLRIDYSAAGACGYLNRCLVWVTEARPLTSEFTTPWASKAIAGVSQVATAMRRGAKPGLRRLLISAAYRALRRQGVDPIYLAVPASSGGAGVMFPQPYSGTSYAVNPDVQTAESSWALQNLKDRFVDYNVTATEASELLVSEMSATIRAAAGPEVRGATRRDIPAFKSVGGRMPIPELTLDLITSFTPASSFGSEPAIEDIFEKAAAVATIRRVSTISLLPVVMAARLRAVERRFKFPRRLAIEWLAGKVSGFIGDCHPELVFIASRLTAAVISQRAYRTWDAHSSYYSVSCLLGLVAEVVQRALSSLYAW